MGEIVDMLLNDKPEFHLDHKGQPRSWHGNVSVHRFIESHVSEGMSTLETGAGWSTVVFASKGARHICIVPFERIAGRIQEYCKGKNIPLDNVTFIFEKSERALPPIKDIPLDFALIDGRHAFPSPFIDWYYASELLKKGGLLLIDDTQILSPQLLKSFLLADDKWSLSQTRENFVIFRKEALNIHEGEWGSQPFSDIKIDPEFDLLENVMSQASRKGELLRLRSTIAQQDEKLRENRDALDAVSQSLSWKVTSPARAILRLVRGSNPRLKFNK